MKKIRLIIIIIFLVFLLVNVNSSHKEKETELYNWNNGYCELDGGRLNFVSVGSKYHYECEICHKEYIFDEIQIYKE